MRVRKRRIDGEDRILKLAVSATLVLFVAGTVIFTTRLLNPRVDAAPGKKILKELSGVDAAAINQEIETLEAQEEAAAVAWSNRPLKEKLSACLILGDGSVQGLADYEVAPSEKVLADPGVVIASVTPEKTSELLQSIKDSGVKTIFLSYGMNDAAIQEEKAEAFRDGYAALLDKIRTELPDIRIYVNGLALLPGEGQKEGALTERETELNKVLQEVCEEREISYIDNKTGQSAPSGEELRVYFENWGKRMADAAEL